MVPEVMGICRLGFSHKHCIYGSWKLGNWSFRRCLFWLHFAEHHLDLKFHSNFPPIFVFETWNCDKSGSGSSMSGCISQMGGVLPLDHHGNCNCIYRSCWIISSAVALKLLIGIPVWAGFLITAVNTLFILVFGTKSFQFLEVIVFLLCAVIVGIFAYKLAVLKPKSVKVAAGLIPKTEIIMNAEILFNATGILGATAMPHSLFLHSSIIQTHAYPWTKEGRKMALRYGGLDSGISLMLAFFVNAAILILAAAAFYYGPNRSTNVESIAQAYPLLAPARGNHAC